MKNIIIAIIISCSLNAYAEKSSAMMVPENETFSEQLNAQANGIKRAIELNFVNAPSFSGKTCTLRIELAQDGALLSVKSEGGDPELCSAALTAANKAQYPPFINDEIYNLFKNAPIDFRL
ncbi:cell envelope integrity protein TolA [Klebsiella sp. BIGb0407]|uniref:cell envelope integrity protein TolA n=1 Tax=Klebsiella sp. BIGb0407 TaxID=2940603 RepID=UPI0021681571|nr:cell envelope integrity protein TolA [Klebsiella sp. BIGb0407]MCS3432924.1 TolA protein [Klebsiella sp. BIGb0407]